MNVRHSITSIDMTLLPPLSKSGEISRTGWEHPRCISSQLRAPNDHGGHSPTAMVSEISAEKTQLKTNNTSGINTEIKVNGQKLETVISFHSLGSVITDESSKPQD